MLFSRFWPLWHVKRERMTAHSKKIKWWIAGAVVAALVLLYIFFPPFHKLGNKILGRSEKEYPKPDSLKVDEFEYGTPMDLEGEIIDVPRDSLLDSLMIADSTLNAGMVMPVDGPAPTPIPGFGDVPLPPEPTDDNLPVAGRGAPLVTPSTIVDDVEHNEASNAALNAKLTSCRKNYNKLIEMYNEFVASPSSEMQAAGAKRKSELLTELSQLMKAAESVNDDKCMEETAGMRRKVNTMKF